MSITAILNEHEFDNLKEYIRIHAPKKEDFISSTGYPAFSKEIPFQVVGTTESKQETAQVGEVADYAFCLEILRYVKKQKVINFQNFFRFVGSAYSYIIESDPEHSQIIKHYYPKLQSDCFRYVLGSDIEIKKIIEYANRIYMIENFHRVPRNDRKIFWEKFLEPCKENVVNEVIQLVDVFRKCFFEGGVITEKSKIALHPRLGTHTSPVGIADLYADGVFYDFKSSTRNGYHWRDVGQVYGYYILQKLSLKYSKDTVSAEPVPIKRVVGIAVYYSRYGDIETCELKNSNTALSGKEIEFVAKMMDSHRRQIQSEHIEQMKKLLAPKEWRKLVQLREKTEAPMYTPENIGYAVGDAVYDFSKGKGYVMEFAEKDGRWFAYIAFELGKAFWEDINKTVLLNWNSMDDNIFLQDTTDYFIP